MTHKLDLTSDKGQTVQVVIGNPISITATALNERHKGRSDIRFILSSEAVQEKKHYDTLLGWYADEARFTIESEATGKVENCMLRECSLDLESDAFRIQIYLPLLPQQVRQWFSR